MKTNCIHDSNEFGTFDNVTGLCWVCGKTASELRARIQKQVFSRDAAGHPTMVWDGDRLVSAERSNQPFPSLLQSAEDERREKLNLILNHEDIEDARINARLNAQAEYEDRDDGRSDGYGE